MGAQGTASLNFGAYPGTVDASLDVSGQTGLVSTSAVEAWLLPKATADHTADEHRLEELKVDAVYKVDGTFTIYGQWSGNGSRLNNGHRLYGVFNVGWVWN